MRNTKTRSWNVLSSYCLVLSVLVVCAVAGARTAPAPSAALTMDVGMGANMVLAKGKPTAYLKVSLTGCEIEPTGDRPPANVALVIDKSGSMQGQKIAEAKRGAIMAIDRLGKNDIVSIVTYDSDVHVLLPATKLTDKARAYQVINSIRANGSTALFGGVHAGGIELSKFVDQEKVNRLVLLSDGLANVGPQSTEELVGLGRRIANWGVTISTIGLGQGYNEDLMAGLAGAADGNHYFCEEVGDLARIYDTEFDDVMTVAAQDVTVKIRCNEGVRPVRVMGRKADISGQVVTTSLRQIYGQATKFILLEVELPERATGTTFEVAKTEVQFNDVKTGERQHIAKAASVVYTGSREAAEQSEDRGVMVSVVQLVGNENNRRAMDLADNGKHEEAAQVLQHNGAFLLDNAQKYNAPILQEEAKENRLDADQVTTPEYSSRRKVMVEKQYQKSNQSKIYPKGS